jgi:WD repeat-containing protein 19
MLQGAARNLIRVSANVDQFPCHVVPILTTTVVECSRAGLTAAAYEQAASLMRPEYVQDLNPAYVSKIEGIVSRRDG